MKFSDIECLWNELKKDLNKMSKSISLMEAKIKTPKSEKDLSLINIDEVGLNKRCISNLVAANIHTVAQLMQLSSADILRIPNISTTSLNLIKSVLSHRFNVYLKD